MKNSKIDLKIGFLYFLIFLVTDYSKNSFEPQFEWSDIKGYDKPIDTVVNSTRLITNGKVSSRQEVRRKITIKPDSEKKKDRIKPK